jgi:hypothetical protein
MSSGIRIYQYTKIYTDKYMRYGRPKERLRIKVTSLPQRRGDIRKRNLLENRTLMEFEDLSLLCAATSKRSGTGRRG